MPHDVSRKRADALRQQQAPRCSKTLELFPTSVVRGGLQGGRERATSDKPWIVTSHLVNGELLFTTSLADGSVEPEVIGPFWSYWTNDEAVQEAQAWNDAVQNMMDAWQMPPVRGEL